MVSIRPTELLRRRSTYSTSERFRWSSSGDELARSLRIETTGNSSARASHQRNLGVVSIHLPSLALVQALDQRKVSLVE
jgi:hypothetical protein